MASRARRARLDRRAPWPAAPSRSPRLRPHHGSRHPARARAARTGSRTRWDGTVCSEACGRRVALLTALAVPLPRPVSPGPLTGVLGRRRGTGSRRLRLGGVGAGAGAGASGTAGDSTGCCGAASARFVGVPAPRGLRRRHRRSERRCRSRVPARPVRRGPPRRVAASASRGGSGHPAVRSSRRRDRSPGRGCHRLPVHPAPRRPPASDQAPARASPVAQPPTAPARPRPAPPAPRAVDQAAGASVPTKRSSRQIGHSG